MKETSIYLPQDCCNIRMTDEIKVKNGLSYKLLLINLKRNTFK